MQPNNGRTSGRDDWRRDDWRRDRDDDWRRDDRRDEWRSTTSDFQSDSMFERDRDRARDDRWRTRGYQGWDQERDRDRENDYRFRYQGYPQGFQQNVPQAGYAPHEQGHRGKGPRNFMRSDERIRETVCEILWHDDRIDASNIDVEVRDGEVMLTGTAQDRRAKRRAEDLIEDLPGVHDVQNRIRVRRNRSPGDELNSYLRGELAAVETYRMALDKLDKNSTARTELEACKRSHEERVAMLREHILRLGGSPATSSGPWGVLARAVEGGARAFGDKTAIAALEEGEDHGVRDYRDDLDRIAPEVREVVRNLQSMQEETHARMSALKRRLQS